MINDLGPKAMVIKFTVSQTFGSFSDIWKLLKHAGGRCFFNCWHAVLVNIINCVSAGLQFLQERVQSCTNPHTGQHIGVH